MNTKLLASLVFIELFSQSASAALAEKHKHYCPDMSEHERVLNEGIQLHKISKPAGVIGVGRFSFPEQARDTGSSKWRNDSLPSHIQATKENLTHWRRIQSKHLPLYTYSQAVEAVKFAEQSEELGMYDPAVLLYRRILEEQKINPLLQTLEVRQLERGLERALDCQDAEDLKRKGQDSQAIEKLGKAVESLSSSSLDLCTRVNILKPILTEIDEVMDKEITSAVNHSSTKSASQANTNIQTPKNAKSTNTVRASALKYWTEWNRQIECLGMAQKLDRAAFNLEKVGQYSMAERLYRQALSIKVKNLGVEDTETIKQSADLGRVAAAQGHKSEARKYFEEALAKLRNNPHTKDMYASMLESYGDALSKMDYGAEANRIYEEARTINEELDKSSAKHK
ncbi:MAG: tetratricopeptide repeat protein [Candidatus Obscuribacterales bacterium]|nr:tetratricopeptide repeat protein [Candidatus Obscuribacterales bacterium]